MIRQNKLADAFTYAERSKGRALLEVLQNDGVSLSKLITASMTADERERESKLEAEVRSLNIQIFAENQSKRDNEALLKSLRESLRKSRLEYEAFRTGLYASHPKLQVKRGEMPVVNLDEAGELVRQTGSAVLEYVVRVEGSYLFVLTRGKDQNRGSIASAKGPPNSAPAANESGSLTLKVYPLEIEGKKLASLVDCLRKRLAERSFNYKGLTAELYELLIGPAREQLRGEKSLIIIPDAALWGLPFQALQGSNGRFLIEEFAISYAPSLTVLREMMKAERRVAQGAPDTQSLIAFGNPEIGGSGKSVTEMGTPLGPLPDAERQVKHLGQLYGPTHGKIYIGGEALEERAKSETGKYAILHFATHGVFDDASPMHSYLVLTRDAQGQKDDGLLEASEVMNLDLHAKLAVLAACETGRGRVTSGEGVIGFTWAFFIAGCPSTVVSLWKVESGSATELMLEFHRNLRKNASAQGGMSKAEALRRSALKLLRSERYRHPAFWAAFVVVGDGR